MAREFGPDLPEWLAWLHSDRKEASDDEAEESHDGGASWQTVIDVVRWLRNETHGLDRVHAVAVELDDFVRSAYRQVRPRPGDAPLVIPLLAVAREFNAVLDDADVPGHRLRRLEPMIDLLGYELGADLAVVDAVGPRPPMWLDVASPAHGQVNVSGVLTAFSKGHVTTADSATVVTANNCTLETAEHYHLRRVSLDCRSLYEDENAMAAFVRAVYDPSGRNTSRLLDQLKRIIDRPRSGETQHYRRRLPASVTTRTERAADVAMGAGSTAHTTSIYHIRETVVPLAELLFLHPDLVQDLARRRDFGTMGESLLAALGEVEDPVLLRNAKSLPTVRTSVSHSLGCTRVRLANAVMVGYGNTLTSTIKVERGRQRLTNLGRFDRAVAKSSQVRREKLKPQKASLTPDYPRRGSVGPVLPRFDPRKNKDLGPDTGIAGPGLGI